MKKIAILDLLGLQGDARKIIRERVLCILQQDIGLRGIGGETTSGDLFRGMDIKALSVDEKGISGYLIFNDEERARVIHVDKATVYDATRHLEGFLEAAKATKSLKVKIAGVDATISSSGVELDATALLADVEKEAHRRRKEFFGVKD
jgi:hypothetical protein